MKSKVEECSGSKVAFTILLPISAFAFLSGTFPTDTALLHYMEQSMHMALDSANAALSIKAYSAICFIPVVVILILAYGARFVMFSGALAQLFCAVMWMQALSIALTQFSCVLAGYCSATWIACCCYGKHLLPNESYVLYYICVGGAFVLGQFAATAVDALTHASTIDLSMPFVLSAASGALAAFVCLVWVPNRKDEYASQGSVFQEVNGPWSWSLRTCRYWRHARSTYLVPFKNSPLRFLTIWFTLEFAVFLSVEATTADFLAGSANGSDSSFGSTLKVCVLAASVARGSMMLAIAIVLRPTMFANGTELLLGVIALLTPPLLLALHFFREQDSVVHVCYMAFVVCSSLQMAAGFVNISAELPFEANVVVLGAVTLLASLLKMMFISIGLSITLYSGLWFGYSAHFCFVAVVCHGVVLMNVSPLVIIPPAPIVLDDVWNPVAHFARAEGSPTSNCVV